MNGFGKKLKLTILFGGDAALLYLSLYLALTARNFEIPEPAIWQQHFYPFSIAFGIWLIVFIIAGLYDLRVIKNESKFLEKLIRTIIFNALFAILVFYLIPSFRITPKTTLSLTILFSTSLIFGWRFLFNTLLEKTVQNKILFFGITPEVIKMADYLKHNPQFGYETSALMLAPLEAPASGRADAPGILPLTGRAENEEQMNSIPYRVFSFDHSLEHIIKDNHIDTIVVSENLKENKTFIKMFFEIIPLGAAVIDFPEFYESITGKIPVSLIQEVWFLEHLVGGKKHILEFFKRAADITLSCLLLIPTLAMAPFVALLIKLSGEGPVFYRQKRVGYHGKKFWLLKFRSMIKDADKMSGIKKIGGQDPKSPMALGQDPRYTKIGLFLRKSYLDELPQIWNILKGEMSFVGPRPERPEYVRELKKNIPFYEMRLLVTPGITGWAQINMEDDASVEDAPEKMQYDLYYIKNQSFLLDLNIILKTILTILSRSGR